MNGTEQNNVVGVTVTHFTASDKPSVEVANVLRILCWQYFALSTLQNLTKFTATYLFVSSGIIT
jgi:hypothetical protein